MHFIRSVGYSVILCLASDGFRVGGGEARLKRGPSDDVIILSQPTQGNVPETTAILAEGSRRSSKVAEGENAKGCS